MTPGDPSASAVEAAISDIRRGRMVVVRDDDDRQAAGDLVLAGQHVTPRSARFMAHAAGGLACVALAAERCDQLGLAPMVDAAESRFGTAFTVSVDARRDAVTGLSVPDRVRTIRVLADPASRPGDLVRPGHVFPVRARAAGVLERRGHTEAAVDLARLAGCEPVAVLCPVLAEDGCAAGLGDLERLCRRHGLRMISVEQLVAHRRRRTIRRAAEAMLPTAAGRFSAIGYESAPDGAEHLALTMGLVAHRPGVPVGVHRACVAGDALRSRLCECHEHLQQLLAAVTTRGHGIVVYLARPADEHAVADPDYAGVAQIIADLGPESVTLLGAGEARLRGLSECGVTVIGREAVGTAFAGRACPHSFTGAYGRRRL
jgi:3,4-dihydroxy 2-butanone 4-phosphate synthase/GTP cyclohydrolase II